MKAGAIKSSLEISKNITLNGTAKHAGSVMQDNIFLFFIFQPFFLKGIPSSHFMCFNNFEENHMRLLVQLFSNIKRVGKQVQNVISQARGKARGKRAQA